jgi:hypothetical protein
MFADALTTLFRRSLCLVFPLSFPVSSLLCGASIDPLLVFFCLLDDVLYYCQQQYQDPITNPHPHALVAYPSAVQPSPDSVGGTIRKRHIPSSVWDVSTPFCLILHPQRRFPPAPVNPRYIDPNSTIIASIPSVQVPTHTRHRRSYAEHLTKRLRHLPDCQSSPLLYTGITIPPTSRRSPVCLWPPIPLLNSSLDSDGTSAAAYPIHIPVIVVLPVS